MTTRKRRLKRTGRTWLRHWTRPEQIENAKEDDAVTLARGDKPGAVEAMSPPLTAKERREHGL